MEDDNENKSDRLFAFSRPVRRHAEVERAMCGIIDSVVGNCFTDGVCSHILNPILFSAAHQLEFFNRA